MSNTRGAVFASIVSFGLGRGEVGSQVAEGALQRSRNGGGVRPRLAARGVPFAASACVGALLLLASLAPAQTAVTGATTGTVTCTNKVTNQSRDAKTGADGVYKFSILIPGDHRLNFSGTGIKPIPR